MEFLVEIAGSDLTVQPFLIAAVDDPIHKIVVCSDAWSFAIRGGLESCQDGKKGEDRVNLTHLVMEGSLMSAMMRKARSMQSGAQCLAYGMEQYRASKIGVAASRFNWEMMINTF